MKEQFATHEIAIQLKNLGFDEDCFGRYFKQEFKVHIQFENVLKLFTNKRILELEIRNPDMPKDQCIAPLWQQVIDWLREKQNICINIEPITFDDEPTYIFEIINLKNGMLLNDINSSFEDPNEAHEQAILKAIDIIKSV